jgi:uncharacterized membrane protein
MPPAGERIEIAPNCSLTPRGALWFFLGICAVSFGIAGALALQGFWPVLPFAGLEMLLLGWALSVSLARRHQGETIVITDEGVDITTHARRTAAHAVFPRHWARVRLRAGFSPLHPSRLTIESQGRHCEIGSFLTEPERRALAARLARLIGDMGASPPLPAADHHRC